jgi:hypothetical protein
MEQRAANLVDECQRQEESCLYTSTSLFEWLKSMRCWKVLFVVAPIILGGVATWPLLAKQDNYKWVTGACALLGGLAPAVYKSLDFDISLSQITKHANQFKILQDRFRQAWRVTALGPFEEFKKEFDDLMARMDAARASSLSAPERFFRKAQVKVDAGHYDFAIDVMTGEDGKAKAASEYGSARTSISRA